jgi:hypothetical protein
LCALLQQCSDVITVIGSEGSKYGYPSASFSDSWRKISFLNQAFFHYVTTATKPIF